MSNERFVLKLEVRFKDGKMKIKIRPMHFFSFINSNVKAAIFMAVFGFGLNTSAQTPAQYVRKGDAAVQEQHWDEAFSYFKQAYEIDSSSFDVRRKYAESARRIKYYNLASELYSLNYQKDNGKLDPDALFWMAMMDKYHGKYEDAQRNFKKYLKKHKATGDKKLLEQAEQEAKSALWALNNLDHKKGPDFLFKSVMQKDCNVVKYDVVEIPPIINSDQSEIAPLQVNDKFYFSSYRDNVWKLNLADLIVNSTDSNNQQLNIKTVFDHLQLLTGSSFANASNANLFVHDDDVYYSSVMNDGTYLVSATMTDGKINAQQILDINSSGDVNTMPMVAMIDHVPFLFFVSDRDGGLGGLDIWYSKNEGGWQKPENAGKRINSPGDEVTPFFYDNKLFFSSDWHDGYGGWDIFSAERTGKSFEKPVNIGLMFNSSYNDISFSVGEQKDLNQKNFFFSSNRPDSLGDGSYCCNDLYMVQGSLDCKTKLNKSVNSELKTLMEELPVVLYFHNDEPNPDSRDTITSLSYLDSYYSYLSKVPAYLKENSKGLAGAKAEDAETITNDFFDLKVKKGMKDLEVFSDLLLKELEKGKSLKLSVRGFASPRAQSDYNLNLTKRRTSSLVNFLSTDSSGVFLPYIRNEASNGARLEFELLPFGEIKSDVSVSDDLMDEKNSIYSRSACLERKIEIEDISYLENTIRQSVFRIDTDYYDFGIIPNSGAVHHDFVIENLGNATMRIDSVVAECGCTDPQLEKSILLPGEKTLLHVGFDPLGRKGKDTKRITIYLEGQEPRIITIEAERAK